MCLWEKPSQHHTAVGPCDQVTHVAIGVSEASGMMMFSLNVAASVTSTASFYMILKMSFRVPTGRLVSAAVHHIRNCGAGVDFGSSSCC